MMFAKEPSSYHDAAKPNVYFNWLMGMGIERQPNLSSTANFFMQLYTIIFALMNWTAIYITWTILTGRDNFRDTPYRIRLMYEAIVYTNSCVAAIAPFMTRRQRKGLRECLRQIPILDHSFEALFGASNAYQKQYIGQIYQVVTIVLVMTFVSICDITWLTAVERPLFENIAVGFDLHYPIIVMVLMDINIYHFAGYLRKKFRDLNDVLLRMSGKLSASHPGRKIFVIPRKVSKVTEDGQMKHLKAKSLVDDNHYLLHEIRKVHLELCKLARQINHAFGLQNLFSMGTSFVLITGLLYTIYSSAMQVGLTTDRLIQIGASTSWTLIYVFRICMVNHSCWRVSREASKTGEVIYALLESRVDKEFAKEVQEFGLQMLQNPLHFDACGFFTLDYEFIQAVIGSITTYLVILIQMSHVPMSSTFSPAFAQNSTEISANS